MVDISLFEEGVLQSEFDLALQELDILFNTENTELIGHPTFGTNFLQFLWMLTPNVDLLERYIEEKIQTNTCFLRNMQYTVNVVFVNNDTENIYVVKIVLYDDSGKTKNKSFIIK